MRLLCWSDAMFPELWKAFTVQYYKYEKKANFLGLS